MRKILLCFVLILVSGCAATVNRQYNGPPRNQSEIAVLEHPDPLHSFFIIEKIDGKWRGTGLFDRYELLPGEHSITCSLHDPTKRSRNITIYFRAEAGNRYVALARSDGKHWAMYIIDAHNRQVVSYFRK